MKIVTVVGARPQFIKAASVSRAIQVFNKKASCRGGKSKKRFQEILVHTGQHYDYSMDKVFFEELKLPRPHHHLGVGSGSHGEQTGKMLERVESVLKKERPEVILVYGDTNSTLAGALAATKLKIPVAHVEAGLRSYDRTMPEEINRLLTDHLSTFLFCPTGQAIRNLSKEGIRDGRDEKWVKNVGDVMYDSIVYYSELAGKRASILKDLELLTPNALSTPDYYLVTLHRAENTDDPKRLKSILKALDEIGKRFFVILPLHPRTRKMMKVHGLRPKSEKIIMIDPVSYLNMIELEKNAKAILTDSGGVQKEAYWLRIPCVTLRKTTEWGYTTEGGWNIVSGWDTSSILESVARIERRKLGFQGVLLRQDQIASGKIVNFLASSI